MRAGEALQAAAADDRAGKVVEALDDLEQAGRGLIKVVNQLKTGVPQGNEVYYLAAVQGYVNSALMSLVEVQTPPAAPEGQGPKIVV
jgi:hypothetical protein